MAVTIDGTNGITSSGSITTQSASGVIFSDSSALTAASSPYVLKNRIINGDMRIDQRNAGAAISAATLGSGGYMVDRWVYAATQSAKFSAQQNQGSVTTPTGFPNYLGLTSASAYSVLSSDIFTIRQYIEGYNFADLAWGTANAKSVTLSFQVYSSLTGTFGGAVLNYAGTRSYPFSYSIPVANTWTSISVTISGDTSGTWVGATNAGAAIINFGLGCGSTYSGTANVWTAGQAYAPTGATSVVGTNGATFYITGVQLEVGSTATPFERRLYGQELANCQRYYQVIGGVNGGFPMATSYFSAGSQTARFPISFPVVTRAIPTVTKNGTWGGNASQPSVGYISSAGFAMELNSSGSGMQYSFPDSTDDTFTIVAEL